MRANGIDDGASFLLVEQVDIAPEVIVGLLLSLDPSRRPALLDSCGDNPPEGRLLIAAYDPFDVIVGGCDGDPLTALVDAVGRNRIAARGAVLPLGAAIGSLSYDLGRRYERLPSTAVMDAPSPEVSLALYDTLIVHDYADRVTSVVSTGLPERSSTRARERFDETLAALSEAGPLGIARGHASGAVSNFTPSEYANGVREVRDAIARGDVYQVNLTQRLTASMNDLTAAELFRRLRERNRAAFSAYIAEPGRTVISTSPERFLKLDGDRAEMWPIKGTRPRGESAESDAQLLAELEASAKDRAENLMIVDLVRNDLGRVAEIGSVCVDELFGVRSLATLHHLVSRVSARLREGADIGDLLRATFPCGSITGAPKIRAMEIIEQLESVRRGLSMGAIGYASFDGQMDWSVAIRTIEISDGTARFNVGGGVVADSDPMGEYEESMWKARAILDALGRE